MAENEEPSSEEQQQPLNNSPASAPLPKPHFAIFGFVGIVAVFFLSTLVFFVIAGQFISSNNPTLPEAQLQNLIETFAKGPGGIASLYAFQFLFLMPFTLLLANFDKQPWTQTLHLKALSKEQIYYWIGIWAIYQLVAFFLDFVFKIPIPPMLEAIKNTQHIGLVLSISLLAPILEECIFRGYLYKAWRHTRLGASGTILVTSLIFTAIHANQYNLVVLAQLFILSLILGIAREKTGSVLMPVIIHAANNLLAGVMIVFLGIV